MKTYSLYFSPTGGTLKVMEILDRTFSGETQIDLSKRETDYSRFSFEKEDLCLIGVPSFGGRVPTIALERIRQMKGNGSRAVIVVVYGNRAYDDTLLELKKEVTACGFQVAGAIAALAEHSILRQFATGRPDEEDAKELGRFARLIQEKIQNHKETGELQVPGIMPYREFHGAPLHPKADETCTRCGLCAANCPVQAIPEEDPASPDEALCISCMRCLSICPRQARKLNEAILAAIVQKIQEACKDRKENEIFL